MPHIEIQHKVKNIFAVGALIIAIFAVVSAPLSADTITDLKTKIDDRSSEIVNLEKEIQEYQKQLDNIGNEKQSLQKEITTIDITRKKLALDIRVTENKITSSTLNIQKLELEIGDKGALISQNQSAVAETLRLVNEIDDRSLAEMILGVDDISSLWGDIDRFEQLQANITERVRTLTELKQNLEVDKTDVEKERATLLALKSKLSDQKQIVDATLVQKNILLSKTKNKESNYKKILAEKEALKEQFEKELLDFESQLKIAIDPDSLPPAGKGVLAWPLPTIRITQYFGNTEFAKSGAYSGKGHNGVDFGASIGTEVKAALSGTVIGTGNTDQFKGCYSYGKWVLIRHENGLTTLYAHLSLIKVAKGQSVSTRETIGYSGNTGYSTGPHLHLTVYASQGVEIVRLGDIKKITNCGNAYIPVAPLNAYLNPLDYL
ncbi:MAG: peptidoglycan DD-metalloendopeptidase family protein [Patescibacteria group bacterium]